MIRVATIGTSTITRRFAEAVAQVDGIAITHVFSRNAATAAAFARDLDAAPCDDLATLVGMESVDAVYVASPNSIHDGQVLTALRAGKHVLVEKPAVPTTAEWDELVKVALSAGVVLLEAMRTAYDPGLAVLRELIPLVGTVRRVSLRYEKRSPRYDRVLAGEQVNIFDPALAGGALMDLGVYCIHALISLFGVPDEVTGASVPIASGADGAGVVLATYPSFVADMHYSKITRSELPSEIQGEQATLLIDHIDSPRSLTVHHMDGTTQHRVLDDAPGSMVGEVARFAALIQSGGDATGDHQRTRQTLQVIDRLRADGRHLH